MKRKNNPERNKHYSLRLKGGDYEYIMKWKGRSRTLRLGAKINRCATSTPPCRFVCVCFPLRHNELTNRRILICMVCMYFGSVAANWGTPVTGKDNKMFQFLHLNLV